MIVLDEPTNALDPAGVIRLRESLLRRAGEGAAILVSSHHLDEVARIADRIVVMNAGRLIGDLAPDTPEIEHAFFEAVRARRRAGGPMRAAIWAEIVKLAGSTVGRVGSAAIVIGISVLSGSMLLAAATTTDPQLLAKLGPVATGDWQGFLLGAAQITGAGGLGGFAVVLAWMFGREFGDGTITGLFALPGAAHDDRAREADRLRDLGHGDERAARRSSSASSASLAGLGPIEGETPAMLARQAALGVMSAAITLPVAWAATLSRSVLGGVSVAIGLVVVAQVSVLAGLGGWMPLAAPALWAISLGTTVSPIQLSLLIPFGAIFVVLIARSWRRMQLDR